MIRPCCDTDLDAIYEIINDAAQAYKGIIPDDRWHEPYMSSEQLRSEIERGVIFWGYVEDGEMLGVMGIQSVQDVTLIRHAYVRSSARRKGIGGQLLTPLCADVKTPILIGTWAAAEWAIHFYEKYGFYVVSTEVKNRLLKTYWTIPDRQVETSVVLADGKKQWE